MAVAAVASASVSISSWTDARSGSGSGSGNCPTNDCPCTSEWGSFSDAGARRKALANELLERNTAGSKHSSVIGCILCEFFIVQLATVDIVQSRRGEERRGADEFASFKVRSSI